jgi:signal transduction histidine kinase
MKFKPSLKVTLLLFISCSIILTTSIVWSFYRNQLKHQFENSFRDTAQMLEPIVHSTKWLILFKEDYNNSFFKFFLEEIINNNTQIRFIGITKNHQSPFLYSSTPLPTNSLTEIKNIIKTLSIKLSIQLNNHPLDTNTVAEFNDTQTNTTFFLYPIIKTSQFSENLLFSPHITTQLQSQRDIIGYTLIGLSTERMHEQLKTLFHAYIIITLCILLLICLLAYFLSNYILKPITLFCDAAKSVANGNYSHKLEINTYKELEKLKEMFNKMISNVKKYDELKSQFIDTVSHEFRTPLNPIVGLSAVLYKTSALNPNEKKMVKIIKEESLYLQNLVESILDFSSIRNNQALLNDSEINIPDFAEKLVYMTQNLIKKDKKDISVISHISNITTINLDETKLKQVLYNLLTNSVKFTHSGTITITAKQEKSTLLFIISDTGKGIREENLNFIFNRFSQLRDTTPNVLKGIGIGLALTQELVTLMGGKISVESTEGKGSTFYIKLPLSKKDIPNEC